MKTDIQIAQEATMLPIKDVAASIGIESFMESIRQRFLMSLSIAQRKILTESSYSLQLLTRLLQGRERQPQA